MTRTTLFRTLPVLLALVGLGALGACATTGGGGSSGPRNTITTEQLAELPSMSAYDAVRRIKPQWLRVRGQDNVGVGQGPLVIVDDVPVGDTDMLDSYQIRDVREIRFLDPSRATLRYGDRAGAGAIILELSDM